LEHLQFRNKKSKNGCQDYISSMMCTRSKNFANYEDFKAVQNADTLVIECTVLMKPIVKKRRLFHEDYVENSPQVKRQRIPLDDECQYDNFDSVLDLSFWDS